MNTKIVLATLALLGVAAADTITFNTPASIVECQPVALSWTGGTAPYIVAVIPGGQPSAAALETIDDAATGTSETWTVNIASGTSVSFKITDSTGTIQYSDKLTIQSGSDSCLSSSASGSSTSAGSSTAAAAGAATTSGSASSAAASSASSAAASSASSSSAASSTSAAASSAATTTATTKASSAASSGSTKAASTSASASASASSSSSGALSGFNVAIPAVALALVGGLVAAF